jgi:hypothetical protein
MNRRLIVSVACAASIQLMTHLAFGQTISLTGFDPTYSQDFDSMTSTGPNSSTPFGWFVGAVGTGTNGAVGGTSVTNGTGTATTGTNYNFGVAGVNPVTDRALGSVASGTGNTRVMEARFFNNTGLTITNLTITYDGEQWRDGGSGAVTNFLTVHFSLDGVTFTPMGSALTFQSPKVTGTAGALDGNASANRVAGITGSYATNILNGATFYVRWVDVNDTGNDHGLAIDNFQITAYTIPEPSTLLLVGAGLLGVWYLRRRR